MLQRLADSPLRVSHVPSKAKPPLKVSFLVGCPRLPELRPWRQLLSTAAVSKAGY